MLSEKEKDQISVMVLSSNSLDYARRVRLMTDEEARFELTAYITSKMASLTQSKNDLEDQLSIINKQMEIYK